MTPVVPIANANMYARHIDVDALRLHDGGRSDCRRADKAQGDGPFYQGSHDALLLRWDR
jgi:hypothetical protein